MDRKEIVRQHAALPSTKQLLAAAAKDTDRVSIYSLGDTLERADLAVIVLKGRDELRLFRDWAERNGLLTPGKPVEVP
jgi:hypothetical protein